MEVRRSVAAAVVIQDPLTLALSPGYGGEGRRGSRGSGGRGNLRRRSLRPLGALRGVGGAVAGDEFHGEPTENVVDQAFGDRNLGVAGHAVGFEADVVEFADEGSDGAAGSERDGDDARD